MSYFSHGPMRGLLSDLDDRGGWSLLEGVESMVAGAGAGLVSSVVTCPLDVVKTKLQAQGGDKAAVQYRGLSHACSDIWSREGIRGFYRGLGPTVIGYLPTWAIFFTSYDHIKAAIVEHRGTANNGQDWTSHIIAAMTGGATATICTNPLWVIKTRFMTQTVNKPEERYKHTWGAMRQIYRSEGFLGFYRGLLPSLLGVTHVAVQFPLYERLKLWNKPPDGSELPSHKILLCSSLSKAVASVTTYPHEVLRTRLQIQRSDKRSKTRLPNLPSSPVPQATSTITSTMKTSGAIVSRDNLGLVAMFKHIAREEGLRGFYRGLAVNLLRTVPSSAITILTYELLMQSLLERTHRRPSVKTDTQDDQG